MRNINKTKKPYIAPKIEAIVIELETGISAGSATVTFGETTNTPVVGDWEETRNEQDWTF